ncbi:MAG: cyclic nucleotide-binding domain-containing protein [Caldilineaceae bacterium]|nr:cyclic nucleotide-binding domain-containing protein [Caldilineaceae bacterium]
MQDDLIRMAPLFMGLDDQEYQLMDDEFRAATAPADTFLFRAGNPGEALYLVRRGFVRLTTPTGQNIATLGPGSILGEDGLFRGASNDVNAVTVGELEYAVLTDRQLRDILLEHPSIGIKLSKNFGALPVQIEDYLVQLLAHTPELSALPRHSLGAVASALRPMQVAAGEEIYRAGAAPQGLYVIQSGAVQLKSEAKETAFAAPAKLEPGALFGVAALLTNKPYVENATAVDDSLIWRLSADDFQSVNSKHPGLRRSLGRSVRAPLGRSDRADALARLGRMPLFTGLSPQTLDAIVQRMVLQHAPAGERVYRIGEAGDALYLIESGEIELTAENASGVVEELARIGADGFFGEMSLLSGQIRTEDATAIRHSNLWVLYKNDLDDVAAHFPELGKALSDAIAARLASSTTANDVAEFRRFPIFANLSDDELAQVARHLEPNRFRMGEQILRASTPATHLFLVDSGEVRVQPLAGGSWILGPGEAFGERALLSNQPHNSTATAETDVDVWTLSKDDFDMLLARYPSLAINISRILSERLGQQSYAPGAYDDGSQFAPTASPRRRPAPAAGGQAAPRKRGGFGQWFSGLTTWGKVRFALLILLIIWLLFIAVPWALFAVIQGTGMADGSNMPSSPADAIRAVYRLGSYEVAAMDSDAAQEVAMADSQVPPTPTYTPFPTATPPPTNTPLPTATPTQVPPTATPEPIVYAAAPVQEVVEPVPEVQTAAVRPRSWDPRLNQLGVTVEDANVQPGQPYWRIVDAAWWDEQESGGKHHIYVEVLDEGGNRIVGQPVTVFWGDGNYTGNTEDKAPPDYAFNFQMYAAGYAYNVKVEGLPSETLKGAGMGSIEKRDYGIHTSFLITYQKTIK